MRQYLETSYNPLKIVLLIFILGACKGVDPFVGDEALTTNAPTDETTGADDTDTLDETTAQTLSVQVAVTGLSSGTVQVQLNSGERLTIATDGSHSFETEVTVDSRFEVNLLAQPDGLSCSIGDYTPYARANTQPQITLTCVQACVESHLLEVADYNVTNADIGPFNALINKSCQSFTLSEETTIEDISLLLRKQGGGTTSATITIYNDAGGSDCEAGASIAQSQAATYNGAAGWTKFEFTGQPTLAAGTYRFVVHPDEITYIYMHNAGNYAGGCQYRNVWLGASYLWMQSPSCSWDHAFRINSTTCD